MFFFSFLAADNAPAVKTKYSYILRWVDHRTPCNKPTMVDSAHEFLSTGSFREISQGFKDRGKVKGLDSGIFIVQPFLSKLGQVVYSAHRGRGLCVETGLTRVNTSNRLGCRFNHLEQNAAQRVGCCIKGVVVA